MNRWTLSRLAAMLVLSVCTACEPAGSEDEAPPFLELSTPSVTFGADEDSHFVEIRNSGGGLLSFTAAVGAASGGVTWLKVEPEAGSLAGGTSKTILLTVINREALQPGTSTGQVSIEAQDQDAKSVAVTLVVGQPVLKTDPGETLSFGGAADTKTLLVSNPGTGALLYNLLLPGTWLSTTALLQKQLAPGQTDTILLTLDRAQVPWLGDGSADLVISSNGHTDATHSGTVKLAVQVTVDASCVNDSDCHLSGYFCDDAAGDGVCVLKKGAGKACTYGAQCTSGFCVEELCCNSQCEGDCRSCGLDGSKGMCTPVADGTGCEDGELCTAEDSCQNGLCVSGAAPDCSAQDNDCGPGACDEKTGACVPPSQQDRCLIGEDCFDSNAWHPQHECLRCLPAFSQEGWSVVADSCFVDGTCYEAKQEIGSACTVCDPEEPDEASAVPDDSECEADENDCTADLCQAGTCVHSPLTGGSCDDGNLCTKADACDDGNCAGEAYSCDDELPCTVDSCDGSGDCDFLVMPGHCLIDGACVEDGTLQPGADKCSSCVSTQSQTQWTAQPDGLVCDDGDGCTVTDVCADGTCTGAPKNCSDGLDCTTDSCADNECVHDVAAGTCLIDGTCVTDGTMAPGTLCLACLADVLQDNWSATNEEMPCDDGLFCSADDRCLAGECTGLDNDCGGDECNEAWCIESEDKCVTSPVANGTGCDDGNACTLDDQCTAGSCGGTLKDCEGQVQATPCTDAVCDPTSEPVPGACIAALKPPDSLCEDGLACTEGTTCSEAAVCGGGIVIDAASCEVLLDNSTQCAQAACKEPDGCQLEPVNQGVACELLNAVAQCDGQNQCVLIDCAEDVYADCNEDSDDGCEVELWQDLMNCGGCDKKCTYDHAWTACAGGQCTFVSCYEGYKNCDATMDNGCEAHIASDPTNCGECDLTCDTSSSSKVGVCEAGQCTMVFCAAQTFNLDGDPANGCECTLGGPEQCNGIDDNCNELVDEGYDLMTDMDNCGGCGQICQLPDTDGYTCQNGACIITACPDGKYDRNGDPADGCEHELLFNGELWVDAFNGGGPDADGTQAHPFATIQNAVDAAIDSNLIHVLEGSYMGGIVVDKVGLVILGEGADTVAIATPAFGTGITVTADDVAIVGLKLIGGAVGVHFQGDPQQYLQDGLAANVAVEKQAGEDAVAPDVAGVFAEYADGVTVSHCSFQSITGGIGILGYDGGIASGVQLHYANDAVVTGCSVSDLMGGTGSDGFWYCGSPCNCGYAKSGGLAAFLVADNSQGLRCLGNVAQNLAGGFGSPRASTYNSTSPGVGGVGAGISLTASPQAFISGNSFTEIHGGEPGHPDWTTLKQEAYGLYLDEDSLTAQVPLDNTLEGDLIVFLSGVEGVVVAGLTLEGSSQATNYGKIVVIDSSAVTIEHNTVAHYRGEVGASTPCLTLKKPGPFFAGGPARGIYLRECDGCVVEGNDVSDIMGGFGGIRFFANSWCGDESADGGPAFGISAEDCQSLSVRHNVVVGITGNRGGVGTNNSGGPAAAFRFVSCDNLKFNNNLVTDVLTLRYSTNAIDKAVGVQVEACGGAQFANFTCYNVGDADSPGYGLFLEGNQLAPVSLRNSVISTVSQYGIRGLPGAPGMMMVHGSAFHDCGAGAAEDATLLSHIEADPLFVMPDEGNFHLKTTSPCIDAGNPSTECNNEPVPNGCRVNMGYYGNTSEATSAFGAEHCSPCP
jgi:hypothetical protein